jgi:hypothetical protein
MLKQLAQRVDRHTLIDQAGRKPMTQPMNWMYSHFLKQVAGNGDAVNRPQPFRLECGGFAILGIVKHRGDGSLNFFGISIFARYDLGFGTGILPPLADAVPTYR